MEKRYLQFPIAVLRPDFMIGSWSDLVVDYACLHYGKQTAKKAEEGLIAAMVEHCLDAFQGRHDYEHGNPDHQAYLIGKQRLGFLPAAGTFFHVAEGVRLAKLTASFCESQPFPWVRIRLDIWQNTFGQAIPRKAISIRELRVLCAIYAAIGDKAYAKVSLERIRGLAAGYAKRDDFAAAKNLHASSKAVLSTRQLRTSLRDLEANRFFSKFTYNRGECFYSHRLNHTQLREKVTSAKLRRHETVGGFRQEDQRASDEIRERKRRLGLLGPRDGKEIPFPCPADSANSSTEWLRQLKRDISSGQGAA